jgi:hypothetical protein
MKSTLFLFPARARADIPATERNMCPALTERKTGLPGPKRIIGLLLWLFYAF